MLVAREDSPVHVAHTRLVVGYVERAAIDSDQFANRATAALRDDSVRSLVAQQVTDKRQQRRREHHQRPDREHPAPGRHAFAVFGVSLGHDHDRKLCLRAGLRRQTGKPEVSPARRSGVGASRRWASDGPTSVVMALPSQPSAQALWPDGQRVAAVARTGVRVSPGTCQALTAVVMGSMVAVTLAFAFTGDHLQRPVAAGIYWSYLTAAPMTIGLLWWSRRPASRFGPLLVGFGGLAWIVSWQGSDSAVLFNIGVLAEAPFWLLTIYLFLAFPMGRVEPRAARWLMAAMGLGALVTFYPWALLSPVIAGGGPLTRCAAGCPENVLQVASAPGVAEAAGKAETYVALALTAAVFMVYLMRLLQASRPQRRALMAVAITSLLFLPAYFAFNFAAWILTIDDTNTLDALAWAIVGTRILLPLGFLIALLQAERFAAQALRTLLERLATRPTPKRWRDIIAQALDDPSLRLGFRDPATEAFREPAGEVLEPPAGPGRAWVPVNRADQPVAAMVIDEALTEDPELVRAAASATLLAVENGALEGELRASRARILEAGHAERQRIERDLHDSAQQRLIALRIHLTIAGEKLDRREERELLDRLGLEVDEAIDELRDVAHGVYPQTLAQHGLVAALEAVARRFAIPIRIHDDGLTRHSEALETSVYFCCLECVQNAAKHAGPGASVTIRLGERDDRVVFSVEDDGIGFDPASVHGGAGLTNLADRVAAVGGTLTIDARPGHGTRISGTCPSGAQA